MYFVQVVCVRVYFINVWWAWGLDQQILLSQEMLGLCQNVEIIHQHHHHFYEVVLPPKHRNRSLLSHTANPESERGRLQPAAQSFRSDALQEVSSSHFYRSKRAYLNGAQRGIQLLSRKQEPSFELRINLVNSEKDQLLESPPLLARHAPLPHDLHCPAPLHYCPTAASGQGDCFKQIKNSEINQTQQPKLNQSLEESVQKSTPTVCRNQNTHHATLRTNQYFNTHQLKHSIIGFKNGSVYETKRKREPENNISLSIPADLGSKAKGRYHQNSEIYIRNNDSIVTRKENEILSAFKTEQMFDDAKSIISLQSLSSRLDSQLNIDESIIVSRTMDYFTPVTHKRELPHCSLYLARESTTGWLVAVREFSFKREEVSLREARQYALVADWEGELPVLRLYRMMMEGAGLERTIFFILEPFEALLSDLLAAKRAFFRAVPPAFKQFLGELGEQVLLSLLQLGERRLGLSGGVEIADLAVANGRFRFHSLVKFEVRREEQAEREKLRASVERLRAQVTELVLGGGA